jgi:SAV_6107-like HEPN
MLAAKGPAVAGRCDRRGPTLQAALDLLVLARQGLAEAAAAIVSTDRYAAAHLAALRSAAALVAARARPVDRGPRHRGPRSVWALLPEVAPELGEWAAYFAASARKRGAAEAGLTGSVSTREADDLLRDADTFLGLIELTLGLPGQPIGRNSALASNARG